MTRDSAQRAGAVVPDSQLHARGGAVGTDANEAAGLVGALDPAVADFHTRGQRQCLKLPDVPDSPAPSRWTCWG